MVYDLGADSLVLHLRTPVLDSHGNPVIDEYGRTAIVVSDLTVDGCDFEVTESEETQSNVTFIRLDGRGMLPPGTPVDYAAALTWNGIKFEVHGPARPVPNIRDTGIDHIAIKARSFLNSGDPNNREDG